ncbi:hypothetical protein GX48_05111 [Paracoccidioides brasiliensis]|nr:hypothetical protein GX48_05111 [Paracoccidioides brasiliensis]
MAFASVVPRTLACGPLRARHKMSWENTFDLLGRLPSSARGWVSDVLVASIEPDLRFRSGRHNTLIRGVPGSSHGREFAL